jgi:long-chain acyl-CoA synthetase
LSKQAELALAGIDLTLAQYRVLGLLGEGSAMSSAISDRLAVRPPSVTALVDGLVARGLVDRHADAGDRRRVAVTVTPAGLDVLAAADAAVDARLAGIAEWLGDGDGGAGALDELGRWSGALRARHAAGHGATR